jgi:hypothetical protein
MKEQKVRIHFVLENTSVGSSELGILTDFLLEITVRVKEYN